jgi:hypothetical protein
MQSILWDIEANPEFQVPEGQWHLWEHQFGIEDTHAKLAGVSEAEAHAKLAGVSKADLLYFYLEEVLPLTANTGTVFPVLYFLWKIAPENLGVFKTSHEEIAKGSGTGVRSVQRAIAFLEEKNLLAVSQEAWSPKKYSRAEYTLVPLAKVRL